MELSQLRSFYAVARDRSVTRAAMRLGLTQLALSLQSKALEAELGPPAANAGQFTVRLLDGGTRPLRARFFLHVQRATAPMVCSLVFDGCVPDNVRPIGDDMGKR
jgi:hypothetical protein